MAVNEVAPSGLTRVALGCQVPGLVFPLSFNVLHQLHEQHYKLKGRLVMEVAQLMLLFQWSGGEHCTLDFDQSRNSL